MILRITLFALCVISAVPAHADISDSGNLTIGGQAVIAGSMTVQGNAFSVGGATFSVNAGTVSIGGLLIVSTIQWTGGGITTGPVTAGGGNINCGVIQSTTARNFGSASGTNSTFGVSVAGSTVTLQNFRSTSYARFGGQWRSYRNSASDHGCTVLLDGAPITDPVKGSPYTIGPWIRYAVTADETPFVGLPYTTSTTLSSGTHTASLACATFGGGTWILANSSNYVEWFTFEEVSCAP